MVHLKVKDKSNKKFKEDNLAKLIGNLGKWQLVLFCFIALVKLSAGWVQMAIFFLTPKFSFRCSELNSNSTRELENSTCYEDCLRYEYDTSPFENTIISEWDLVCERRWLASFTQMILQLGVAIGSWVFGYLSDRYGRRKSFLASIFLLITISFAVPYSPNYEVFTAIRFIQGFAVAGTMVISFVLVMETVGPPYRELLGCIYQIPYVLGHALLPLFAYYHRSWNSYTLALAIPQLFYLTYFFIVPESPRWLLSMGRVEDATRTVKRAAQMNNLPTVDLDQEINKICEEMKPKSEYKPNVLDIFRNSLFCRSCCFLVIWNILGLTFLGLNQYISETSTNQFVSVAVAGCVEVPSTVISVAAIKCFGRRLTVLISFCVAGVCMLALGFVPNNFWFSLILGSLGVSFISIVGTTLSIYTSELYPTVVRNIAMGTVSLSLRVGCMVAPFISSLSVTYWLPTIIFGLASIVAGLACLLLPDSNGDKLPDSLADIKSKD